MIETAVGQWNPLVFLAAVLSTGIALWIFGKLFFSNKTRETEPFYSGNKDMAQIPSSSLYWGFFQTLRDYYQKIEKIHTGRPNEYVGWLVITIALMLITLVGGAWI